MRGEKRREEERRGEKRREGERGRERKREEEQRGERRRKEEERRGERKIERRTHLVPDQRGCFGGDFQARRTQHPMLVLRGATIQRSQGVGGCLPGLRGVLGAAGALQLPHRVVSLHIEEGGGSRPPAEGLHGCLWRGLAQRQQQLARVGGEQPHLGLPHHREALAVQLVLDGGHVGSRGRLDHQQAAVHAHEQLVEDEVGLRAGLLGRHARIDGVADSCGAKCSAQGGGSLPLGHGRHRGAAEVAQGKHLGGMVVGMWWWACGGGHVVVGMWSAGHAIVVVSLWW